MADGDDDDGALLPHSLPTSPPHDQRTGRSVPSASITDEALLAPPGPHSDQQRGVRTEKDPSKRTRIVRSIEALGTMGKEAVTTGPSLSGTWRLLWTTEKEQLFIVKIAGVFGTEAGDVLQVIDVEGRRLNNVITFPPHGAFFVRSAIEVASAQRINFK